MNTILIIDDDPQVGRLVGAVLRNAGFNVRFAQTPVDGIHQAMEARPDLIITDYEMGDVNGADVCVQLKSRTETKDVPVVLVSGTPDFDGKEIAGFTGADAFLAKPISSSGLVRKVRELLA